MDVGLSTGGAIGAQNPEEALGSTWVADAAGPFGVQAKVGAGAGVQRCAGVRV